VHINTEIARTEAATAMRAADAKVCRDLAENLYDHAKGPYLKCAEAIELLPIPVADGSVMVPSSENKNDI